MNKAVSFRLDPDLVDAVRQEAQRRHTTVTALVVAALTELLADLAPRARPGGADLSQYRHALRPSAVTCVADDRATAGRTPQHAHGT